MLGFAECGGLAEGAGRAGVGDHVLALELLVQGEPGLGGGLGDTISDNASQQRMTWAWDAVFFAVVDGAQVEDLACGMARHSDVRAAGMR